MICMVMLFSFIDWRRRGPRSLSWSRMPGRALNCSLYAPAEGPVRDAWEKKCSSRVMRGGKVMSVVAMIDGQRGEMLAS